VSDAATVTSAGRYCWRGVFTSGTTGVPDSSDHSTGECFTVNPVTPAFSTTASGSVPAGTAINDTAHLSGTANEPGTPVINPTTAGGPAQGSITFKLYGPSATPVCNSTDLIGTSVVNVSGDNDYLASSGTITGTLTPTVAGTYYWVASYTGDSPNTNGASGACGDSDESVTITSPFQGCTPGFWKNHQSVWDATTDPTVSKLLPFLVSPFGYDHNLLGPPTKQNKNNSFNNQPFFGYGSTNPPFPNPGIFGLPSGPFGGLKSNLTLIAALNNGGGAFAALARHGTAALLSSQSVKYTYGTAAILNGLRNAFLSGNANQVSATFPDGILTDLTNANQLSEAACPTS
jgi:hypothetical protein